MSPSLGAINQNLFSVSVYFMIPMSLDYFSNMAINSLSSVIPKWRMWAEAAGQNAVLKTAAYPFPDVILFRTAARGQASLPALFKYG